VQGTNRVETNSSQSVTGARTFDAFGNLDSTTGSPEGPFGFVGQEGYQSDSDSGLQLLGHRYYDPSTGRFLTRDHAKDGRNWYSYCANKPLECTDPSGLNGWLGKVVGAGVGLVVATLIVVTLPIDAPIVVVGLVGAWWVGGGTALGGVADGDEGKDLAWDFAGGAIGGSLIGPLTPAGGGLRAIPIFRKFLGIPL